MNPSAPPFNISPRRKIMKPNWAITSDEVEQGCILWLGTPTETFESQRRRGATPAPIMNAQTRLPANEGMYEHPFLVLSRLEFNPFQIYFLPMTSLSNKTLASKFIQRKATYHQSTFLSITPAETHPLYLAGNPRYRTLTLGNGDALEKSTYVNIREVYEMDWRDAQLYWGSNPNLRKKWKLDGESIQAVLALVRVGPGKQYCPPSTVSVRAQLLQPLNRRLSNPVRQTPSPPYGSPKTPFPAPRKMMGPPAIHPALQAEFYPRPPLEYQVQQEVDEQRPLLSFKSQESPVIPGKNPCSAEQEGDGTWEF